VHNNVLSGKINPVGRRTKQRNRIYSPPVLKDKKSKENEAYHEVIKGKERIGISPRCGLKEEEGG